MSDEPSYITIEIPVILEMGSRRESVTLLMKIPDTPESRAWAARLVAGYVSDGYSLVSVNGVSCES